MRFVLFAGALCLCAQDTVIRTTVPLILVPATVTDPLGNQTVTDLDASGRPLQQWAADGGHTTWGRGPASP